jgi:AraC-like DNA-binding protein
MDFEPTLSPRFVAYVRDYLMDRGVNPDPVFAECGIHSRKDEDFDTPVPVQQVVNLFELAARYTANPCMGLTMGQEFHYEAGSLLILAMLAAPSVEGGMRCLNRFDKYVDTGIETMFDFSGPLAEFGARPLVDDVTRVDQLNEYLMAFLVQTLNTATRKAVPLVEVWLCHDHDRNRAELESFFAAPVRFSKDYNKLVFQRAFLKERFFSSNDLLYDILTKALRTYFTAVSDQNGFIDLVSREIIRGRGEETPSAEKIAVQLAISPRTLRRRLAEEGFSFQEAKNLARERQAKYYLGQTSLSLSEIAFELGYSELSAFSRAFRSWAGETPQAYREQVRQII